MIVAGLGTSVYLVPKLGGLPLPPLTVPERLRSGIVRIAELPQSSFDQLLTALANAPECKDRSQLGGWIGNDIPEIPSSAKDEILVALTSMFRVHRSSNEPLKQFVKDVRESLDENGVQVDGFLLESRLASLLEKESLDTAAGRVSDFKTEVERNFCKVRAFTDLRPVFRADPSIPPTEMAIIHNFQICYHDGMEKHHEFYISLDAGDLKELKRVVVESEKRAETLDAMLGTKSVNLHK
jgi:hypothetical protein